MKLGFFLFVLIVWTGIGCTSCLQTSLQCTNQASSDDDHIESDILTQKLEINCGMDLIFIAWSHYGHETTSKSNQTQQSCVFAPSDCIVNVDYISNECNGLTSCQISLDTQYLHSCKAYSDYLFILYDCIESKNTVNICDNMDMKAETDVLYFKTPNYPNEYTNNLNCKCNLNSNANQIQFQTIEFDLEDSSNQNYCAKDYLNINQTKYCSNLSSYKNLISLQNATAISSLDLQFNTDDALTRRGFWIKTKVFGNAHVCPDNFYLINNACIRIYTDLKLTWFEAKRFCTNHGFDLLDIGNFETSKQINHILGGDQLVWTSMKHLNKTHWFNENNSVIIYDDDVKAWWPWLEFDNTAQSRGTCVAKRKAGLMLEECYQNLQFACQYKIPSISSGKEIINLQCGTEYNKTKPHKIINQHGLDYDRDHFFGNLDVKQHLTTTKTVQTPAINSQLNDKFNHDSNLFLMLIGSIILLIAFINIVVLMILCRRRKMLMLREQHNESKSHTTNSDHLSYATTTESDILGFNYTNNSRQLLFTSNNNNPNKSDSLLSASFFIDKNDTRNLFNLDNNLHVYETISISDMYGRNGAMRVDDGLSKYYDMFTNSRSKFVKCHQDETLVAKRHFLSQLSQDEQNEQQQIAISDKEFLSNPHRSFNMKQKNSNFIATPRMSFDNPFSPRPQIAETQANFSDKKLDSQLFSKFANKSHVYPNEEIV